jgi:HK97 family phage portal protein
VGKSKHKRAGKALVVRSESTPPAGVIPPVRSPGGRAISAREALSLSAVYRAFQILATAVSQLSVGVWRGDVELPVPSLIATPDVLGEHQSAFFESTVTSLAGCGNGYWRLYRPSDSPADPVINIELLSAAETLVVEDQRNPGRVAGYRWRGQLLQPWEVRHLKMLRIPGSLYGLGPIQAAQADLSGAADVRDYATGWFQTSGMPDGILKTDQKLNRGEAEEYRADWYSTPAGQVRVLGQGLNFVPFMLKPSDAQWLENQKFSVTQVARLFGIPATYLLAAIDGTSMNYTNQEQVDIAFVRYTLMAYLREIEQAFTALIPRGQVARFKVDTLLRTDTKTRMETYEIGLRAGIYQLAWVQATEGLPITNPAPVPNGTPDQEAINA